MTYFIRQNAPSWLKYPEIGRYLQSDRISGFDKVDKGGEDCVIKRSPHWHLTEKEHAYPHGLMRPSSLIDLAFLNLGKFAGYDKRFLPHRNPETLGVIAFLRDTDVVLSGL